MSEITFTAERRGKVTLRETSGWFTVEVFRYNFRWWCWEEVYRCNFGTRTEAVDVAVMGVEGLVS